MTFARSEALYEQACRITPGGVHSPVRAFRAVGGTPVFVARAEGAQLWDVDGNRFIDLVNSWGASILGHAYPAIVDAIAIQASRGTSYGAPHPGEIGLAAEVTSRMPGMDWVRFVNSGTEATLSAIRLARAVTGRSAILKFEGHYHGAVDSLLVAAGSGIATLGMPGSAGVLPPVVAPTLSAPMNDLDAVQSALEREPVAAVMVEPVAGNMGCVLPEDGFLAGLRERCSLHGALLIFDEVMTGFRLARGGAAERYGVTPDLSCLGKVIGGGLPVGAYGGRRDLMEWVAPLGPMYQAGTLSGNPLAMAAGLAALTNLHEPEYAYLEQAGHYLATELRAIFQRQGINAAVHQIGSMLSVFFCSGSVRNFHDAQRSDAAAYAKLFHAMLRRGVYLPPSALEAWFLTTAHSQADLDVVIAAFAEAARELPAA